MQVETFNDSGNVNRWIKVEFTPWFQSTCNTTFPNPRKQSQSHRRPWQENADEGKCLDDTKSLYQPLTERLHSNVNLERITEHLKPSLGYRQEEDRRKEE